MLLQLTVKDFALIERAEIEFDSGFNILTGETGAGKSIIIDAVSLLLGGRAKAGDIRVGCEKARVEGVFSVEPDSVTMQILQEADIEAEDGQLILQREISAAGKNVCRINDRTVTLSTYRSISHTLINIYGQHDYQAISNRENHILLLDSLGDEAFQSDKQELQRLFGALMKVRRRRSELEKTILEQREKQEFLQFKLKELTELHLREGEEDELEQALSVMDHAEKIASVTRNAYQNLYGDNRSVYALLTEVAGSLGQVAEFDPELQSIQEQLQNMQYLAEDFGMTLSAYEERLDFDEAGRERMNERKYILDRAKRKYQSSIGELIQQRDKMAEDLQLLSHGDDEVEQLKQEYRELKTAYVALAEKVQHKRRELATVLTEKLLEQLRELAMENTRFEVRFTSCNPTALGMEEAEFFLSANPGQPLRELREIASGGEMSRIMLAFKTVLAEKEQIGTLIFDEIDTGIGGNILGNVADKLSDVSRHTQVICVTHAPILAARATRHFRIRKQVVNGDTVTEIIPLSDEGQIAELARMLGGEEEYQLQHARALKNRTTELKS